MINKRYEITKNNEYQQYSNFTISKSFERILRDDYFHYNSKEFTNDTLVEALYKKHFYDKYNENEHALVYEKYINNKDFKNKALFIYSIIDEKKYMKFVKDNENINNPNEYSIEYSIIDSKETKVNIYNLNLLDISFVF